MTREIIGLAIVLTPIVLVPIVLVLMLNPKLLAFLPWPENPQDERVADMVIDLFNKDPMGWDKVNRPRWVVHRNGLRLWIASGFNFFHVTFDDGAEYHFGKDMHYNPSRMRVWKVYKRWDKTMERLKTSRAIERYMSKTGHSDPGE